MTTLCRRLSGVGGEAASIFRLDRSYGGGKSHGLIALCHAARGARDVPDISGDDAAEANITDRNTGLGATLRTAGVRRHGPVDAEYEIWQLPTAVSPHVTSALRVAGLRGRNLELVEHRVLKRLSQAGIKPRRCTDTMKRGYALTEDLALALGLLFRTLAPMRSRDNMRAVTEGIEAMVHEEAAYWLGMAMHRKQPRRVLTALRCLPTEPKR